MQVTIKNGFVENWSINGHFENEISVKTPEDYDDFFFNSEVYKIQDGKLVKDENEFNRIRDGQIAEQIRERRTVECFSIINRGELWYAMLTEEQKDELKNWYMQWLEAPQTKMVPSKPLWLK